MQTKLNKLKFDPALGELLSKSKFDEYEMNNIDNNINRTKIKHASIISKAENKLNNKLNVTIDEEAIICCLKEIEFTIQGNVSDNGGIFMRIYTMAKGNRVAVNGYIDKASWYRSRIKISGNAWSQNTIGAKFSTPTTLTVSLPRDYAPILGHTKTQHKKTIGNETKVPHIKTNPQIMTRVALIFLTKQSV